MHQILPFKLDPTYREYVWGGKKLRPDADRTAEAWVVYEQDRIADGLLQGLTLGQASQKHPKTLLGSTVIAQTRSKFPLLIKILDCAKWLSLQVHPNNDQAVRWEGPNHYGKMEGWYVIDAEKGAQLISGFKPGISREQIQVCVGKKSLLDLVDWKKVKKRDSILIKPGTLHALGPGLLIYEVQQTSDITYRVYDWDRPKKDGRKLHIEQAADVLDPRADGSLNATDPQFSGVKTLFTCPFFELELIAQLAAPHQREPQSESFEALTIVQGDGVICGDGWQRSLKCFETLIIPASVHEYQIQLQEGVCLCARVPAKT